MRDEDEWQKILSKKFGIQHVVYQEQGKPDLLYIDLHLIHEVTSPQAFEGLRLANRKVRRPDLCFATMDHNVPTQTLPTIKDPIAEKQINNFANKCEEFGIPTCRYRSSRPRDCPRHWTRTRIDTTW